MKITHNEEAKEFKPFSITLTFESEQEAINLLHYFNVTNCLPVRLIINRHTTTQWPRHEDVDFSEAFHELKKLLQSKRIIK